MRNLIFLILALLLIVPMVVAQQQDIRFYHDNGENLTIYEKCRVDGARCDSSYECFLTVLSPDQILIIEDETMKGPGVYYNFTLNSTQTLENGIYEATVDCTNSTNSGSNTFFYQNTPNGSKPIDEGQGLILLGGIILLIIVASFMGLMGFKLNNGVVGLALMSFSVMIFIFTIGMLLNIFEVSLGTFSDIINNYSTIYVLFIILGGVGVFALVVWLIVFALKLYWEDRGMSKKDF